jgi:hypothetical protein
MESKAKYTAEQIQERVDYAAKAIAVATQTLEAQQQLLEFEICVTIGGIRVCVSVDLA